MIAFAVFIIPLSLFVLTAHGESYDFIVGCGINTIPKFIKAVLGLIVKVGIPVASMFLIWAGFLFLTAQGNETKLTAAKHAFLWSCIGFGILLGAWLLAIAFEGVITSFSGGQAQDTTITPC